MILPLIGVITFSKVAFCIGLGCLLGIAGIEIYRFIKDKVS